VIEFDYLNSIILAVFEIIVDLHPVDWSERHEDSSKMLSHFLRAWADSRKYYRVLREYGAGETPQALKRRGGSLGTP
jgi:hypothetical protein